MKRSRVGGTHLKRVVRFFTILMVAAMGYCEKLSKNRFFRMGEPSDGCELHPAIPTTKPRRYWDQSTRNQAHNPSLGTLGRRVRTVMRDTGSYRRGGGMVGCAADGHDGKPPNDGEHRTPDTGHR